MSKAYKFESGLTLLYQKNSINNATSIKIGFDGGARCDGELPGVAYFCERMFFTQTDKLSKQEVTKRFYDFIQVGTYTSSTETVFHGQIITSKLENFLMTVQDMICNTTISPDELDEERKLIIQSIVRDRDNHAGSADRVKASVMYGEEFYKYGVLGTEESVNKITSADIKKYIKKYLVSNNCYIQISSPLSFVAVKKIVKEFDKAMPKSNMKPLPYEKEKLTDDESIVLNTVDVDKNFFSFVFKSKRKGPDSKYKTILGIIGNIMTDIGEGLKKELRVDHGLIYSMGVKSMVNQASSSIQIITDISRDNVKPCIDVITGYIKKVVENGFTDAQLQKELGKKRYYWDSRVDHPNGLRDELLNYRSYGRFVTPKEIYEEAMGITIDEVNQVARELFTKSKVQVFVYGNAEKTDVYTIKQVQKKMMD